MSGPAGMNAVQVAPPRAADRADVEVVLSVVVVTWNCRDLALRCLRHVTPLLAGVAAEILVVDNASEDGTLDAVAAAFPAIRVIGASRNLGFAAANNLAFAKARGRYWLLLNPDAFPAGATTVARLLAFMSAHPDVAAVGPRLLHEDGRHQVGDAGFAPSLGTVLVHAFSLMRLSRHARGVFLTRVRGAGPFDVDWLCGACMLVRADAARRVGLLDESFFLYGEDIEWGCRMRDGGWRVVYLADAEAMHLGRGTQGALAPTRWLDGLAEMYRRRNAASGMAGFRIALALGFGARAVLYGAASLLPGSRALRSRAQDMAVYALHGAMARGSAPGRDPPRAGARTAAPTSSPDGLGAPTARVRR